MWNIIERLLQRAPLRSRRGVRKGLLIESLEQRRLLSSDWFHLRSDSQDFSVASVGDAHLIGQRSGQVAASSQPLSWRSAATLQKLHAEGEQNPEGEPADDLVAFAKALAATSTVMYGADWNAVSSQQKRLFEDGGKYLPYINVTNPDRTPNQIAVQNNITVYPTWVFPDGSRLEGLQSLATISQRSGVVIPKSAIPYLSPLSNLNVGIGSPQHQPVDAYSPTGAPLTITVTSSNPNLIAASVQSGNRSLQIETDFGDMVFQLFEDKAPRPTGRVIELAQSGFYNGLTFHRIINGFMIQGGDPDGNGTGGSPLGNFDDQFHLDLQHNRPGILSFAKAGDDTNNSQFFITAGPTRHLDFNHSVFGQLVEGNAVRDAINRTATGANDRPTHSVIMRRVTVFRDTENAIVLLKPVGSGTGSSTITVTASDGQGNTATRSFVATVVADTANGAPFLNDIPVLHATAGVQLTHTLTSQDKEGDPLLYAYLKLGTVPYELDVNQTSGVIKLTAPADYNGQLEFLVGVRQTTPATTSDVFDIQKVTVDVLPPIQLTLDAESDTGLSNSDRVTNATTLKFTVSGVRSGSPVEILADGEVIAVANASGSTTQVTVPDVTALGERTIAFSARRNIAGRIATSPAINVRLDRTSPVPLPSGLLPQRVYPETLMEVNLNHPEENQGLRYALQNPPSGMTIDAVSGLLRWTPSPSQVGTHTFKIVLTDLAGNVSDPLTVSLEVVIPPTAVADSAHTMKNESVLIPVLSNDVAGSNAINPSSVQVVSAPSTGQLEVRQSGEILYTPAAGFVGIVTFRYRVADQMQESSNEALVTVRVINSRWHNPTMPLDVTGDRRVAAIDALQVINYLNSGQPRELPMTSITPPPFLDVNDDERVTALDALLIINHLNQRTGSGEGEGGSTSQTPAVQPLSQSFLLEDQERQKKRRAFLSEVLSLNCDF